MQEHDSIVATKKSTSRRTFIKGGLVLAATAHTAVAVAEIPDSDLLRLGEKFEALFAEEEAARIVGKETDDWSAWDVAYARTDSIVQQIEATPATTAEGLRIKARCIQWCYGDDPVEIDQGNTTDVRLAQQIVQTLLKMANPAVLAA